MNHQQFKKAVREAMSVHVWSSIGGIDCSGTYFQITKTEALRAIEAEISDWQDADIDIHAVMTGDCLYID